MRRAGPRGAVALLACLLATASCAGPWEPRTALLDRKPVRYALAGEGGPTIVFEAGLGDGMDSWSGIFPQAAALSAAFAYDRPGYGGSVTAARRLRDLADFLPGSEVLDLADLAMGGPAPVDAAAAVDRLDRLLSLAGARPPYVLVGHSLGGQYVQAYAARHPSKVAGILLVDARPRRMDAECRRLGLDVCAGPPLPAFLFPPAERAELAGAAAAAQVPGPGALGDIPVARLVRAKPEPWGAPTPRPSGCGCSGRRRPGRLEGAWRSSRTPATTYTTTGRTPSCRPSAGSSARPGKANRGRQARGHLAPWPWPGPWLGHYHLRPWAPAHHRPAAGPGAGDGLGPARRPAAGRGGCQ